MHFPTSRSCEEEKGGEQDLRMAKPRVPSTKWTKDWKTPMMELITHSNMLTMAPRNPWISSMIDSKKWPTPDAIPMVDVGGSSDVMMVILFILFKNSK